MTPTLAALLVVLAGVWVVHGYQGRGHGWLTATIGGLLLLSLLRSA